MAGRQAERIGHVLGIGWFLCRGCYSKSYWDSGYEGWRLFRQQRFRRREAWCADTEIVVK